MEQKFATKSLKFHFKPLMWFGYVLYSQFLNIFLFYCICNHGSFSNKTLKNVRFVILEKLVLAVAAVLTVFFTKCHHY